MSWKSHGTDNASLVQALRDNEIVTSESVESAMRLVDRGYYARDRQTAYVDAPQAIGSAATISAPHMHAYCLELMRDSLKPGNRVLDVGSGSGYLTAVMAHMVRGEGGLAVGLEHIPSLHRAGEENCRRDPGARTLLDSGELVFVLGDGRRGHLESSPYDCIHVGAAATSIPSNLLEQLARGGRLVCPVGKEGGSQRLVCVDRDRDSGKLSERIVMGVQYVPLCSKETSSGGGSSSV
eukprot:CAMPEP_0197505278 /NCGR_PEP_ID=MMETSP1312-20131121/4080_1 /TAXON_ID=464262 /ORGANISM="Genus nov. species nov., Strain RCC2335" /LENGTH=236 /DNA_ID=CAMNT_0043052213 /DNA_START=117 /DNA_END=828 /DNA_ORIENTATION=-